MEMNTLDSGQMTVEFAIALPVLLIVAIIATNALLFMSECAAFDGVFQEAVRVHVTAPAYGDAAHAQQRVTEQLSRAFSRENENVQVSSSALFGGNERYTATLSFRPTLFGLGLRSSVFGIELPALSHQSTFVVQSYKPGVVV